MSRVPLSPTEPRLAPRPFEAPPGLPTVYAPALVMTKILRMLRWIDDLPGQKLPAWGTDYRPQLNLWGAVLGFQKSPRGRWVVQCETCRQYSIRLMLQANGTWGCMHCTRLPSKSRLWIYFLAELVFAYRIQLYGGQQINRRRATLARMLAAKAGQARKVRDLWLLAVGAPLLTPPPAPVRCVRHPAFIGNPRGQLWAALAPLLVGAWVDSLLHPVAFRTRFGAA